MGVKLKFWKRSWWVFVNTAGRRKAKRVGDKETGVRLAQAIRERLARGALNLEPASAGQTLDTYVKAWLESAAGSLKASTVRFYHANFKQHVLPILGSRQVTSLRRQDCRELITICRAKGLRVATVRGIVRALSTVLTQAVEDDLLTGNPALRLGKHLRQGDEAKREIQPLTREEAMVLLTVAGDHFLPWQPLLLCALRTGMRQGELLALRWADVDFSGRCIAVNQNLVRGILTTPKSHQRRRVDMSSQLAAGLTALRARQREQALKDGKQSPELVFPSADGTLLDDANVRHMFYRILEKADVRRVRFHDLRHTFASWLIQQGESLPYVRDQLGHKSIAITVDVYGHLVPGGNHAAVDRLDDAQPNATPAQPAALVAEGSPSVSALESVVSRVGIEPTTRRLRVCCSAN
jgi:integrase